MPIRQTSWSDLVPGVLALGVIIAAAFLIIAFGGVGTLHGEKVRFYFATSQARGLIRGSDVWLDGQLVGKVGSIRFRPPSVDTGARIIIALDVLKKHREQVRANSFAQIRAGGTLIGQPVVYLSGGTSAAPVLAEDDTIASKVQPDFEGVASQVALASRHFPEIISNVKAMNAALTSARGTLGAFGLDENRREIDVLRTSASSLAERALSPDGALGQAKQGRLMERAKVVMARADTLQILLDSSLQRAGEFRRDSTLPAAIADLRNEVSIVRARLAGAEGTAGRVLGDSAVFRQLAALERTLTDLMADVKRHPMRYVHFE